MKSFRCHTGLLLLTALLLFAGLLVGCEQEKTEETSAEPSREVPEMDAFVEAFKMIWTAANNNDYQTVRDSAGVLQAAGEKLTQATLPEFHQDLANEFATAQENLTGAMTAFNAAVEGDDDAVIDQAIDDMRIQVITMFTLLSPDIAEIEAFHEILAPLWHEALPNNEYDTIRESIPQLMQKADALTKVTLPEKYAFLQDEFLEKSNALVNSIEELAEVCLEDSLESHIDDRMETMHDAYHDLVECLD
jgi:hypothetical protein